MGEIIYQNDKIKIKYDVFPQMGFGNYYLHYKKYRLPLTIENELTYEQAEQLVKVIEPALDRLHYVARADGLHDGRTEGEQKLQNDLKKLLGIEEA